MFKPRWAYTFAWALVLGAFVPFAGMAQAAEDSSKQALEKGSEKWVVTYHNNTPVTDLFNYDLVVLDASHGYDVRSLVAREQTVLAYVSIGEVENYRPYFKQAKKSGVVLQENKNWPGSYYVDVRKPAWTKLIIEQVIPDLLRQGYTGLMLDTIDNPIYLASKGKDYKGMDKAAANLVKAVRHHYPDIHLMLNRGFEILPEVAPSINSVLAESTYTTYDFETKKPRKLNAEERAYSANAIKAAEARNDRLKVYSLDYWPTNDTDGVKEIYTEQAKRGYVPYVSTVELDKVFHQQEDE